MAGTLSKKRKVEEGMKGKVSRPVKKFKKQTDYQSSSEDEAETDFQAVNLQDSDEEGLDTTDLVGANGSDADEEPAVDEVELEEEVTDASNSDSESGSEDEDDENENAMIPKLSQLLCPRFLARNYQPQNAAILSSLEVPMRYKQARRLRIWHWRRRQSRS
jgi:hypothetical protein